MEYKPSKKHIIYHFILNAFDLFLLYLVLMPIYMMIKLLMKIPPLLYAINLYYYYDL